MVLFAGILTVSFGIKNNGKKIFFKGSSLGKKYGWNTIKDKVKYDKNRDDELIRRFAARKKDDENSIGRSFVEPSINDNRAVDGIDDDIIRISQHSIKSDTTNTNQSEQLIRSNNNSFKLSEKYNRPASHQVRRTTQKATQILNRVKKQYLKKSIKPYNQGGFNSGSSKFCGGSIGRIFDHAETAITATDKFRLKSRGNINSRATKIEEMRRRLGISKSIIPSNKEKIIHEETKEKPAYLSGNEIRFKSKLKSRMKMEMLKSSQQEDEQLVERQVFKPR